MIREGWNFKNDVAIVLERIACAHFNYSGDRGIKIYDSDAIQQYYFAEVMICLLRDKTNFEWNTTEEVNVFIKKASQYIGVRGNDIEREVASSLMDEFVDIFNNI